MAEDVEVLRSKRGSLLRTEYYRTDCYFAYIVLSAILNHLRRIYFVLRILYICPDSRVLSCVQGLGDGLKLTSTVGVIRNILCMYVGTEYSMYVLRTLYSV